jgi:hypothetical protein
MIQPQMVRTVVDWERRLAFEEEKRAAHRREPYVNYLAAPQPLNVERTSFLARWFKRLKPRAAKPECCTESAPAGVQFG